MGIERYDRLESEVTDPVIADMINVGEALPRYKRNWPSGA
jgi:hypothetical protein